MYNMSENYSQKDIERATADQKISSKLESIQSDVLDIKAKLDKNYVTKDELATFKAEIAPYINAVKYLVTLIVSAVVVAIITLVIKK